MKLTPISAAGDSVYQQLSTQVVFFEHLQLKGLKFKVAALIACSAQSHYERRGLHFRCDGPLIDDTASPARLAP